VAFVSPVITEDSSCIVNEQAECASEYAEELADCSGEDAECRQEAETERAECLARVADRCN
jgi:hypothetical protein